MATVLLVDDDEAFVSATAELLTMLGHETDMATTVSEARTLLESKLYDRVLLDLMLPDGSGFHLLENIPLDTGRTKATIITGHSSVSRHVMSLYGMNVNYLVKPISLEQLQSIIGSNEAQEETVEDDSLYFGALVGESTCMKELYEKIERVAASQANVMLFGESGVGKEVVAQAVHNASQCGGPLIATNCGAFSRELLGSELFGHKKGAFTGAVSDRKGLFEQSHEGTLFLDEITEMPLPDQPALLRALESKTVTPLGSTDSVPFSCRVIAATNKTEQQMVAEKCLREDLYFRLAVFPVRVPSLRERREDISLLARHFISALNRENGTRYQIDPQGMEKLAAYDWPGNVRELRHTIHRAFIMSSPTDNTLNLEVEIGSPFSTGSGEAEQTGSSNVGRTIEDVERELIMKTLEQFDQNKTRAAEVLGVSVKTLYNRLNAYED